MSKSDHPKKQSRNADVENIEDRQLKKAVETIHMSGKLTLSQRKIFNNLVAYAYSELGNKDVQMHRAGSQQLVTDTEFDSRNIKALRASLNAIMDAKVELNLLNDNGTVAGFNDMRLLSEVKLLNGIISYSFPHTLRALLHDPKIYAVVNLKMQNFFKSGYSLNLYENLIRFRRVGQTKFISIPIWRKIIGAEAATYDSFKMFNSVVLKTAVEEINQKGDIFVEPEFEKLGRTVVSLRFLIKEKEKKPFDVIEVEEVDINPEVSEVHKRLLALGLSEKGAMVVLGDYAIDYLEGNLSIVELRIKAGLDNPSKRIKPEKYAAYLNKALSEDWIPGYVSIDKTLEAERNAIQARQQLIKKEEDAIKENKSNLHKQKLENALEQFNELSPKQQAIVEEGFKEYLELNNSLAYRSYLKQGLDGSALVQKSFNLWLADNVDILGVNQGDLFGICIHKSL